MTNQYQAGYKAGLDAAVRELRLFTNAQWYADVIAALPIPDHLPDATKKVEPPKLRRAGSFGAD